MGRALSPNTRPAPKPQGHTIPAERRGSLAHGVLPSAHHAPRVAGCIRSWTPCESVSSVLTRMRFNEDGDSTMPPSSWSLRFSMPEGLLIAVHSSETSSAPTSPGHAIGLASDAPARVCSRNASLADSANAPHGPSTPWIGTSACPSPSSASWAAAEGSAPSCSLTHGGGISKALACDVITASSSSVAALETEEHVECIVRCCAGDQICKVANSPSCSSATSTAFGAFSSCACANADP
mmetsp:Transcript_81526/g.221153  ORF Transcript_81526/g.221153 Transcript_81526/m.221153 type:complete len:238 (+) Transcript_81526:133-846(+)